MRAGSGGLLFGGAVPPWDEGAARAAFAEFVRASAAAREDDIFAPMATIACRTDGSVEILDGDGSVGERLGELALLAQALAGLARHLPLDVRPADGVHEVLRLETWNPLLSIVNALGGERLDLAEGWVERERPDWIWSEVRSKCEGRVRAARLAAAAEGWDASLGRRLVRRAHGGLAPDGTAADRPKESFLIEPAAVRLVELAEAAGALPLFSCEGHPGAESMDPETQLLFRPDPGGRFADWMTRAGFRVRAERPFGLERVNAVSRRHADFEARDGFLRRACARIEAEMARAGLAVTT